MDLLKTMFTRSQLHFAYMIFNKTINMNYLVYRTYENIDIHSRRKYFKDTEDSEKIYSTDHVEFNGIEYNTKMVLVLEMGIDDKLKFGKIVNIFIKNDQVYFLLQRLIPLAFENHTFAYRVIKKCSCLIKNCNQIPNIHQCLLFESEKGLMVAKCYIL